MNFAAEYARTYDEINQDKNYEAEVKFVEKQIGRAGVSANNESLLDLGCGTGRHLEFFDRSFTEIVGVDRSAAMCQIASERLPRAEIHVSDIKSLTLERRFDVIVSLFDVLSYQISSVDVLRYLRAVKEHLNPSGLAVIDFWHLPGLITQPPAVRSRSWKHQGLSITRISSPVVDWVSATTSVEIRTLVTKDKTVVTDTTENHTMRAFLIDEVNMYANAVGLEVVSSGGWMTEGQATDADWHAFVTLRVR